jgi:hypothetical protein
MLPKKHHIVPISHQPAKRMGFLVSGGVFRVSKQISPEATRVFMEDNNFIILKTSEFVLFPENIPAFKLLRKKMSPNQSYVWRSNVYVQQSQPMNTLITAPEVLPLIILVLWQLDGNSGVQINWPRMRLYMRSSREYHKQYTINACRDHHRRIPLKCVQSAPGNEPTWILLVVSTPQTDGDISRFSGRRTFKHGLRP